MCSAEPCRRSATRGVRVLPSFLEGTHLLWRGELYLYLQCFHPSASRDWCAPDFQEHNHLPSLPSLSFPTPDHKVPCLTFSFSLQLLQHHVPFLVTPPTNTSWKPRAAETRPGELTTRCALVVVLARLARSRYLLIYPSSHLYHHLEVTWPLVLTSLPVRRAEALVRQLHPLRRLLRHRPRPGPRTQTQACPISVCITTTHPAHTGRLNNHIDDSLETLSSP